MSVHLLARGQTATMSLRPVRRNLLLAERLQASEEAARCLSQARERAQALLAEAEAGADLVREAARAQGREQGWSEVAAQVAEATRWRTVAVERHLQDLVALATEMSRRILRRELASSPESLRHMCQEVIRENLPGRRLVLVLHPADLEGLAEAQREWMGRSDQQLALEVSDRLERGDCIVRGELGEVDARLSVQLEELAKVLLEGAHDGPA